MTFLGDEGELLHESGCTCERCRNLIAALVAQFPNGEYAFTDEEIERLAK